MKAILDYLKQRAGSEKGVTTVEYAIMLVLVAIAVAVFGSSISDSVKNVFSSLASTLK